MANHKHKSVSRNPFKTCEYYRMETIARKHTKRPKIKREKKPTKITFVLATLIFCFLASCFTAYILPSSPITSLLIEIITIGALIIGYMMLRKNLSLKYKKVVCIVLSVVDIFFIFIAASMLYYISVKI